MQNKRDGFIDFFKGSLILWIIHIHTVFWSGREYIPEIARQVSLLMDVATFFFISGYLTKLSSFVSSIKKSAKQFINLYLNYLAFSCLLLFPLFLLFVVKDKAIPDLQLAITSMLRVDPVGELWGDIPVYKGSLWYMCVYFSILLILPIITSFFSSRKLRVVVLAFLLLIFYLSRYLNWSYDFLFSQTVYIYFYLFVYMLGVAYRLDEQSIRTYYLKLTFFLNVILSLIVFFYFDNVTLQIHSQKFPPSFNYLIYSLLLIHVFVITKRIWNYSDFAPTSKIFQFLEWCGKNVYFIYLVQAVVCSVPDFFIPIVKKSVSTLMLYFVVLTFNMFFTLLLTFFYVKAKTIFAETCKHLFR